MDFEDIDLRIVALILAILSILMGYFLPVFVIVILTAICCLVVLCLMGAARDSDNSGGIGLIIFAAGIAAFTLVPMWGAYFVRIFFVS